MSVDKEAFARQNNCSGTIFRFVGYKADGTERPFANRFTNALYDSPHITIEQLQGVLSRILQHAFVLGCIGVKVLDSHDVLVGDFS